MELQVLFLTFFFFIFLVVQIMTFQLFEFSFLENGNQIRISTKNFLLIVLGIFILVGSITFFILNSNMIASLLFLYTLMFLFSTFLTFFLTLKIESPLKKSLAAVTISSIIVSLVLLFPVGILKNILIAGSLLWVAPVLLKKFKIKKPHLFAFMFLFMLFDIYNVYYLTPQTSPSYNYFTLNGYIEFGRLALGMGDFFLGYLAVSLLYLEKGYLKATILALLISLPLLAIGFLSLKHEFPYTIFIVIPALLIYFLLEIKKN